MEENKGITRSGSVEITNPKLIADLNLATSKLSAEFLKKPISGCKITLSK